MVSSELARPEFASAVHGAHRAGRLTDPGRVLRRIDADCGGDGPVALLRLDASAAFQASCDLLEKHQLRTLDAIHLAVALEFRSAVEEDLRLVTRDENQGSAAVEEGLPLA